MAGKKKKIGHRRRIQAAAFDVATAGSILLLDC
jgi:hypothetical protein